MAEVTWLTIPWWETGDRGASFTLRLWRPFLPEPRHVVHNYLHHRGLQPIIDETNEDRTLRRNAIRYEALPLLERIVPGARGALARFAAIASAEDAFLEHLTEQALPDVLTTSGCLNGSALRAHPLPIQRRLLRLWLERQGVPSELSFERLEAALAAVESPSAVIQLGFGWTLRAKQRQLCLTRDDADQEMTSNQVIPHRNPASSQAPGSVIE
jgi:tRNA(Ile)-lysidine synthase TilS/MesJ